LILVVLFSAQRFGPGAFGKLFGPIIVGWFSGLAITGSLHNHGGLRHRGDGDDADRYRAD